MGVYIGDILNKIRFDKDSNLEEYSIIYFERIAEKTFEVSFVAIKRRGNFFSCQKAGKQERMIPLHRIKQVKYKGKVIWDRERW